MNKRFKQLMEQAQVVYDYAPFYGNMDRDPAPLYKLDPEKFAELIVRECMQVVDSTGLSYKQETYSKVLSDHFGVE